MSTIESANANRRSRLIVSLLILLVALLSLVILHVHRGSFWVYTLVMSVVVAFLYLGLRFYLNVRKKTTYGISLWRQVLYWVGFLAAVYMDMLLLQYGVVLSVQAGLFALILWALALFFIGIIEDLAIALVGIGIALMVIGSIVIQAYLLLVVIPITIVMGFSIFLLLRKNEG